jgi:hypothetical protein
MHRSQQREQGRLNVESPRTIRGQIVTRSIPQGPWMAVAIPPGIYVCTSGMFPEPKAGQEFWGSVSGSGYMGSLREARKGRLLLAGGYASPPFDAATAAAIERMLGVRANAQANCAYSTVITLWDVLFETAPPVRVSSETTSTVQIAGNDYNVWVLGEGGVWFALYANPGGAQDAGAARGSSDAASDAFSATQ